MPPPEGGAPVSAARPTSEQRVFPSIWAFILADCCGFGIFFAVFIVEHAGHPQLFDASSRLLDPRLGLLNTLILLTGSWLVALAVEAARKGQIARVRRLLLAAIVVSSGFAVIKVFEYATKIGHGITPLTNDFFTYYYMLTGVHFLHYLVGMAALVVMAWRARSATSLDHASQSLIESGGLYWHLVDLLWVFIFPMLYMLGGL